MPQHNSPYRFLASESDLAALTIRLKGIGIESVCRKHDRLVCAVPWLSDPIAIDFQTEWWPDGDYRVDDRVTVTHAGSEQLALDVGSLLRERHETKLSNLIIDELISACSEITGKPRTPKQRSEQDDAVQPATVMNAKAEGNEKPKPESEERFQ